MADEGTAYLRRHMTEAQTAEAARLSAAISGPLINMPFHLACAMRAHHRVLHFVNRHPGLMIAELLEILGITKQSLNRVLKELLDSGYVEARSGVSDRRQRLLYPTPKGRRLTMDLSDLQSRRFERALGELPDGARAKAVDFLFAMIEPSERERVASLVWSEGRSGTKAEAER